MVKSQAIVSCLLPRVFLGRLIIALMMKVGREKEMAFQFQLPLESKTSATLRLRSCLLWGPAMRLLSDPWGSHESFQKLVCWPEWMTCRAPILTTFRPLCKHLQTMELLELILSLWLQILAQMASGSWSIRQAIFPRKAWFLAKHWS